MLTDEMDYEYDIQEELGVEFVDDDTEIFQQVLSAFANNDILQNSSQNVSYVEDINFQSLSNETDKQARPM